MADTAELHTMVLKGMTHKDIGSEMRRRLPGRRGFSERTIRRRCSSLGIHKLRGTDLDEVVKEAVSEVSYSTHTVFI